MSYAYIIAEIGINHNGDMKIAKKLINMAKKAGCDAVKFQKRTLEKCISKSEWDKLRETPWGNIPYLEYKKHLEFGEKEYNEIDQYCRDKEIEWFASAWDLESQAFLRKYDLKYNKVASPMLTNTPLLEMISMEKKMTFISTGMSTPEQIDKAIDVFHSNNCPFILLHCVSTYPCKDEDCNLRYMRTLGWRYPVGYSGHEIGILPSIMAVTMGATVIERHITLDRAMYGTDQSASLERKGLELLVRDIRRISAIMGDGIRRISQEEFANAKKLRYFEEES